MNQLTVFNLKNIEDVMKLKEIKKDGYYGYVYVIEYGDKAKIGCSNYPYQRMKAFNHIAKCNEGEIQRIALTPKHTNFRTNEHVVHKLFADARIDGTEVFKIQFDSVIERLNGFELEYLDESAQKEENAKRCFEIFKYFFENKSIGMKEENEEMTWGEALSIALKIAFSQNEQLNSLISEVKQYRQKEFENNNYGRFTLRKYDANGDCYDTFGFDEDVEVYTYCDNCRSVICLGSLDEVFEKIKNMKSDECLWEVKHFCNEECANSYKQQTEENSND